MFHHLFPYGKIEKDSNIVIYAAGDVGMDFYYQVKETQYCNVVMWVDKNYRHYQAKKMPVECPDKIKEVSFDKIVIAVALQNIALEIRKYLLEMGISSDKIIWCNEFPRAITPSMYIRNEQDQNFEDNLVKMTPKEIVSSERLDIIVRYLFARDIVNHVDSTRHQGLYSRFILTGIGAEEPLTSQNRMKDLSDYDEKVGVDTFVNSFIEMTESMRQSGFFKEKYIPLNKHGAILNGSHRLAAALALEENVWVKYMQEDRISGVWNQARFERDGFLLEDNIEMLRAFADLYDNCNMLIMFGGIEELWDFAERRILSKHKRVGAVTLNFESDYLAFENLIRELYYDSDDCEKIVKKLLFNKLSIRVILFSDENEKGADLYLKGLQSVKEVSEVMQLDINDIYYPIDRKAYQHCKSIFLSNNNLAKASMLIRKCPSVRFERRISELVTCLEAQSIPVECVCLGTDAIMEVFGLREAEEIGVMVLEGYEEISLPDGFVLIGTRGRMCIVDDNYHFIYRGVKINNPENLVNSLIDRLKDLSVRINSESNLITSYKESKRDYRLLQLLFDYTNNFNNKKALKERFDFEIRRQWSKNSYYE